MGWVVPRIPLVSGARKHRSCFLEGERRAERHQRTRTAREKENSGSGQRRTTIDSSVASVEICLLPSRNFTNGWANRGEGEKEVWNVWRAVYPRRRVSRVLWRRRVC